MRGGKGPAEDASAGPMDYKAQFKCFKERKIYATSDEEFGGVKNLALPGKRGEERRCSRGKENLAGRSRAGRGACSWEESCAGR